MNHLDKLNAAYRNAPEIFHAGRYWKAYEDKIVEEVKGADLSELRSGKYPIFTTFGFNDLVYYYHPRMPFYVKFIRQLVRKLFIDNRASLPYSLRLSDIREMAYKYADSQGQLADAYPINKLEASDFGKPQDLFSVHGKKYTMKFLSFYVRYSFAHKFFKLRGDETIIELGSGSGFQVELLKKIYPDLTILCFDLPAQLYLCEKYLTNVLGENAVVGSEKGLERTDLHNLEKGKIHLFGNWQFPLLANFKFDIFWNAASFGEMEPEIVANYLSYIKGNFTWAYLMQARNGKESSAESGVVKPILFADYSRMLGQSYSLVCEEDAYDAHRRVSQTGGYFQAVWQNSAK
ncbi:putative sugar O-methyltransferase [Hymenobacter sp. BT683]|uniref:Sugar O-methyltransferase n=1 Tax=Hymenobacter jeongseonensis TaxID=2791027 RepID=A0ABS0IGF0_9BACT|nr:putative sugar O-methyltransferase [Hymenobacter jeongseonensis]MBF9237427.1 putative sugar O-methyltransferase [Hymenobacter jeongseonensis]